MLSSVVFSQLRVLDIIVILLVGVETGITCYEGVLRKGYDEKGQNLLGISTHRMTSKSLESQRFL
jgi:hypothetical protein